MTDLELDVWDAWLRERQEHLEETLSNISPSEEPCRYYLLTGYIQGMLEALTMLTTVEDGKRFKDQTGAISPESAPLWRLRCYR